VVDERVTDGRRVAQLLASELTGLERGPLDAVAVEDAKPDAEPSAAGTVAFHVAHDDERVGHVEMYPAGIELVLTVSGPAARAAEDAARDHDLSVAEGAESAAEQVRVTVPDGARVKRAVDVVSAALSARR
jgi:hypothetical protein